MPSLLSIPFLSMSFYPCCRTLRSKRRLSWQPVLSSWCSLFSKPSQMTNSNQISPCSSWPGTCQPRLGLRSAAAQFPIMFTSPKCTRRNSPQTNTTGTNFNIKWRRNVSNYSATSAIFKLNTKPRRKTRPWLKSSGNRSAGYRTLWGSTCLTTLQFRIPSPSPK